MLYPGQLSTASTFSDLLTPPKCVQTPSHVPLLLLVPGLVWNWCSSACAPPLAGGRGTTRQVLISGAALVCALAVAGAVQLPSATLRFQYLATLSGHHRVPSITWLGSAHNYPEAPECHSTATGSVGFGSELLPTPPDIF